MLSFFIRGLLKESRVDQYLLEDGSIVRWKVTEKKVVMFFSCHTENGRTMFYQEHIRNKQTTKYRFHTLSFQEPYNVKELFERVFNIQLESGDVTFNDDIGHPDKPKVKSFKVNSSNELVFLWNGKEQCLSANYANGTVGFAALGYCLDVWWSVTNTKEVMLFLRHIKQSIRGPLLYCSTRLDVNVSVLDFFCVSSVNGSFETSIENYIPFRRHGYIDPVIQTNTEETSSQDVTHFDITLNNEQRWIKYTSSNMSRAIPSNGGSNYIYVDNKDIWWIVDDDEKMIKAFLRHHTIDNGKHTVCDLRYQEQRIVSQTQTYKFNISSFHDILEKDKYEKFEQTIMKCPKPQQEKSNVPTIEKDRRVESFFVQYDNSLVFKNYGFTHHISANHANKTVGRVIMEIERGEYMTLYWKVRNDGTILMFLKFVPSSCHVHDIPFLMVSGKSKNQPINVSEFSKLDIAKDIFNKEIKQHLPGVDEINDDEEETNQNKRQNDDEKNVTFSSEAKTHLIKELVTCLSKPVLNRERIETVLSCGLFLDQSNK